MIIKGDPHGAPAKLAEHLMNADKNERVELVEIRELIARDLRGALAEIAAVASGTRCTKPLYQANIDPDARFPLTREQWREAVDALEEKLGFTGQPQAVVMHIKNGREHCHVVWSRIRLETMTAVSNSHNYRKHEEAARDLERRFGHERVQGAHAEREGKPRPARTPERADLTELWGSTDSGRAFAVALADRGYVLARGDRRDFVVLDSAGAVHSLVRRIEGVKTAAVRARMADVERASLPTIEQARAQQVKEGATAPARADAGKGKAMKDEEQTRPTEPAKPDHFTATTPDALCSQHVAAAGQVANANAESLLLWERQGRERRAFVEEQEAGLRAWQKASHERDEAGRYANSDITDAKGRYAEALGKDYDVRDPYASLARAAMSEYGAFMKQQQDLTKQIGEAKAPEERRSLELRREIEGWDYLALGYDRGASITRVSTGNMKSEDAQRMNDHAAYCRDMAKERRAERAELEFERREPMDKDRDTAAGKDAERQPAAAQRQQQPAAGVREAPAREIAYVQPLERPGLTPTQRVEWNRPASRHTEAPARAGEPPRTAAQHNAVNRQQQDEKRQRTLEGERDRPADSDQPAAEAGKARPKESAADRKKQFLQRMATAKQEIQAGKQGVSRGSGGRGGGGRD